jgi:D-alanine-D-alanine ligase
MHPSRKRVAILFGGVSTEHDVSIVSAASIARSMDRAAFDPVYVGICKDGRWLLGEGAFDALRGSATAGAEPVILSTDPSMKGFLHLESHRLTQADIVFPVLHGPRGEDGTVQGLLELAGIPYVGCDTLASAVAMDKDMTKRILTQRGLPVVKGTCVTRWMWEVDRGEVMKEIRDTLKGPFFVKPATMGSSIGISRVAHETGLADAIDHALGFSTKAVVEHALERPLEVEIAVLGNNEPKASIPGQIIPGNEFYDFNAKYVDATSELVIPARIPRALAEEMQYAAVDAFAAIGGSGMARVDFLVCGGDFYLNEINTIPGFTSISMYPRLWDASGIPYADLITKLIELGFMRYAACAALTRTIDLVVKA